MQYLFSLPQSWANTTQLFVPLDRRFLNEGAGGSILPSRGQWQCLETFVVVIARSRGMFLASSGCGPGMLLNFIQCTRRPHKIESDLAQYVNRAPVDTPCSTAHVGHSVSALYHHSNMLHSPGLPHAVIQVVHSCKNSKRHHCMNGMA